MKKKILFIESGQGYGGSSKYLVDLFHYLDKERYEPSLAYYQPGMNFDLIRDAGYQTKNLNIKLLPATTKSGLKGYLELLGYLLFCALPAVPGLVSLIRREKIDMLHLNNELLTHVPGILAGKLTGRPVICHFQGFRKLTKFEKLIGAMPDAYLALSVAGAKLFSQELGRDVMPLHHAVDLKKYAPEKYQQRSELKSQYPGYRLVGLVGRLVSWKGQNILIQSAKEVLKQHPNTKFLLIGDDPDPGKPFRVKLEKMVSDYGIQDSIVFMGWQNDIPGILSQLDVFVHASTEPEAFGIVIIEAMAMNKPVIGTNAGGVPELIDNGVSGYLIPLSDAKAMTDALLKLMSNSAMAAEMGKVGRSRVEKYFDIRQNAAKLESLYESLGGKK